MIWLWGDHFHLFFRLRSDIIDYVENLYGLAVGNAIFGDGSWAGMGMDDAHRAWIMAWMGLATCSSSDRSLHTAFALDMACVGCIAMKLGCLIHSN